MTAATVLAKQSDVSLYTVRHYTRIGLLRPVRNSNNNYKIYQERLASAKSEIVSDKRVERVV